MLRTHVINAVFQRNVKSYFSGILGYLFIVVFVFGTAMFAFNAQFFTNNLANLDQLNLWFPYLLLGFIPAITMGVWADERKTGTDELLFTLPASDVEILLGKYFAVLLVYAVALAFSLTNVVVLAIYGEPDTGVIFANYFGYFLAGASLLACGMFASVLTNSTTVAFVLGSIVCAVPVFIGKLASSVEVIQELSLSAQLREFGLGMIPASGLVYFISLAAFMLYLNLVMISKRHWSSGASSAAMGAQFGVRAVSLAIALCSLNVVVANAGNVADLRADLTAEKVYSLSNTTKELIDKLDKERPITIQAFISPEVPGAYAEHQQRLRGLLRQFDRIGGSLIAVRFVDVEPFSEAAEEARHFGIVPRTVQEAKDGRFSQQNVFLGAVIESSSDQVIVPFFDLGTPIEYELTRSIRTASNEKRLTVGILTTDAKVAGGFDMSSFRSLPEWQISVELKKQYNIEQVDPGSEIDAEKYDVLLAVLPSSLTQPQMANFVNYVDKGKPVLIFDDPLPVYSGGQSAPRMPKPSQGGGGMMGGRQPPPEPKADGGKATSLLNVLGIGWENGTVVWDKTGRSLHPEFAEVIPPELVFVSPKGLETAFNPDSDITSGLQEMLAFFPGRIRPVTGKEKNFEPLLRTSVDSGLHEWEDITEQRPAFFGGGISIRSPSSHPSDDDAHVLAAHIRTEGESGLNVIYVADVDSISDQSFSIVKGALHGLKLDNVRFVLNAVDVLAGDEAYIELRKRRAKHRILTRIQDQEDKFRKQREDAVKEAEDEAKTRLEDAQDRLTNAVDKIRDDESLSRLEMQQQIANAQSSEQRKLDIETVAVKRKKDETLNREKAEEQRKIRVLEDQIRIQTLIWPPIPAFLLALIVLGTRFSREKREIDPRRLVK